MQGRYEGGEDEEKPSKNQKKIRHRVCHLLLFSMALVLYLLSHTERIVLFTPVNIFRIVPPSPALCVGQFVYFSLPVSCALIHPCSSVQWLFLLSL